MDQRIFMNDISINKRFSCAFSDIEIQSENLIYVTLKSIHPSIDDTKEFFKTIELVFEQMDEKFMVVFDATNTKWINGKVRVYLGKNITKTELRYKAKYVKCFVIVPNTIVELMLKGINFALKPQIPQKTFTSKEDTFKAVEEELTNW